MESKNEREKQPIYRGNDTEDEETLWSEYLTTENVPRVPYIYDSKLACQSRKNSPKTWLDRHSTYLSWKLSDEPIE